MLSKNLELSLHRALSIAREYKHEYATLEHLLLALTDDPDARAVLESCSIKIPDLCKKLKHFLANDLSALISEGSKETKPTAGFQRVVHKAAIHVHASGKKEVNGSNVLAEIFSETESFAVFFLNELNVTRHDVMIYVSQTQQSKNSQTADSAQMDAMVNIHRYDDDRGPSKAETKAGGPQELDATNPLVLYCTNLNKQAQEGAIDILIGREKEIERTIEVLCRRNKNNPLFVGEPGVGKTAIAEGLAYRIVSKDVPHVLLDSVIYSLDMGAVLAGTRYRGDFEERIKSIIKEIQRLKSAILFIDEMHIIIGAGSTSGGSIDAGNLLKPALARPGFRCVGATTYKEYKQIEKDGALARRFQPIFIDEPSVDNTIKILRGLVGYYERFHDVRYTVGAIEAAVKLSARYINDRHLPDKAIDVLDEAGAHRKVINGDKIASGNVAKQRKTVTVKDIETTVSKIVHIPIKSISSDEIHKLQMLEQELKKIIFGQNNAIEELSAAIKLSRAGLRDHKKPIGCYLFSGPTGVGKTELAKQLATLINMQLLRFDMSEYMEMHSVARLIGSPPGYVGFDQGGLLTDSVIKSPYSVLLLDEIEKAHVDIYNILLQVMDYGKLTDHNGRTVNFSNTILIMTTNVGASEMSKSPIGFGRESSENDNSEQIKRIFSPEFRNRLDAIIQFSPLTSDIVGTIVDKFIKSLEEQLADRAVRISVSKKAKEFLCEEGFDQENGARKLERIISEKIKKVLADEILFGKLNKGGKANVSIEDGDLIFGFNQD